MQTAVQYIDTSMVGFLSTQATAADAPLYLIRKIFSLIAIFLFGEKRK